MINTTLDTLALDANNCSLCKDHLPLGIRPVFQVSSKAKILIAG